jgi:low temperature requirement protein LtrA
MLLGVIAIAAGVKKSLGHVGERLDLSAALALALGVMVYVVGDVVFRKVLALGPVRFRSAAGALALGTVALGLLVSAAVQLVALIALECLALLVESRAADGAARPPSATAAS